MVIEKGLEVSLLTGRSAHGVLHLNMDSSASLSPPSSTVSCHPFLFLSLWCIR